jgi:Mn2+/Fe2+ NRAMP family transporter
MGLYTALIVIGALVVLVPGLPLIGVIVASQNLNGVLLPVILAFMLRLAASQRIMGRHANPRWLTAVGWVLTGLVVLLTGVTLGAGILAALR